VAVLLTEHEKNRPQFMIRSWLVHMLEVVGVIYSLH